MKRVVKNGHPGSRQGYMNKVKFNPNKYKDTKDHLPDKIIEVMTTLCCKRCCDIIQWKLDYGKYTPLEAARKCNLCSQRKVTLAHHRICRGCSMDQARCTKCQKPISQLLSNPVDQNDSDDDDDDQSNGENSVEGDNPTKVDRFLFLTDEPRYEELAHLRGLDVRALEQEIFLRLRAEHAETLKHLPERKRRTLLRAEARNEDEDDDDELL